uniref:Uncharacterized protein n=1 Tax=Romanomermis culicivorax TaxID=13658 RepID=A0A915JP33_ROMCU
MQGRCNLWNEATMAEGVEVDCFNDRVFILLLAIGLELGAQEHLYPHPVVRSIGRNDDGVVAVDQGE